MGLLPRVRVGIIGAGAWAATNHIPILASRPEVELVVACRRGGYELRKLQERFGFAYVTEDFNEALAYGLDAVVVASPPAYHAEHVKASLNVGAHVMCEKPFTVDPADAWSVIDLAASVNRQLIVAFGWNWLPAVQRARELLLEHPIGVIRHVLVHMASDVWELLHGTGTYQEADPDFPPELSTWSDPSRSGGGYAPGQLSHGLALLLWLTGLSPVEVAAAMTPAAAIDIFDAIVLKFENGGVGVASGASTTPGGAQREQIEVRIFGSGGHLTLDLEREELTIFSPHGLVTVDLDPGAGLYDCSGPPNALIDLALGRPIENRSPARLGAAVVEVIRAAGASASSGVPVRCGDRSRSWTLPLSR